MGLGYAFEPSADQAAQAKSGTISPPFGSQGAIQTLNYQLPNTGGAVGAALSPMVSSARQGSGITSAVLESVLRTVLGPDHASMVLGQGPQPDSGRADNGPQDYANANPFGAQPTDHGVVLPAQPASPTVGVHAGELTPDAPNGTLDTNGQPSGGKTDVTPLVGGFNGWLGGENGMNGRPPVDRTTPNFGGGGRQWITGQGQ